MHEVARIFHLTPGMSKYKIKSELVEENEQKLPSALGNDTIYLNMRSVLADHDLPLQRRVRSRGARAVGHRAGDPGPDGRPFDWTQVTAGQFFVHSQKHRPRGAEVAVQYRGYWFYIPQDDVTFAGDPGDPRDPSSHFKSPTARLPGPLLTLPVGG